MGKILQLAIAIIFRVLHFGIQIVLSALLGKKQGCLPKIEDPILKLPAVRIAEKIRRREVKSEDVVKAFIKRIRSVNPVINAVVEDRFLSALDEASVIDKQLLTTNKTEEELASETPFLGVPMTTKNGIAIKGLLIDAGILYRKGRRAQNDSLVVKRMIEAGAIPLCVTNVPELCMWLDSANKIHGRTGNPYDLNRIPGGSSGGEAALLSSAGSVIGLGNDIAGSIRSPCSSCGIFGHKPTPMIVPQNGQFPRAEDNDLMEYVSTGPMCRYAEDLIPIMKVISGDKALGLKLDQKVEMKSVKVFYTENFIRSPYTTPIYPEMAEAVMKVEKKLRLKHKLSTHLIDIPTFNTAMSIWYSKLSTAKAPSFEDFLTDGRYAINPYWELIKWFFRVSDHTLHIIFLLLSMRWHSGLKPDEVTKNVQILEDTKKKLISLLGDNGVLLYPPHPEPPIFHYEQLLKMSNWGYTAIFNVLGFPVTVCPVGLSADGLPLAVQVVASPNNDRLCLQLAQEIQDAFGGWKEP